MDNNLQDSIIYADIRPEINERLSLGILTIEQGKVQVMHSEKKLSVLKQLTAPRSTRLSPLLCAVSCVR